jgi:hypothetical protein
VLPGEPPVLAPLPPVLELPPVPLEPVPGSSGVVAGGQAAAVITTEKTSRQRFRMGAQNLHNRARRAPEIRVCGSS